MITLKRLVRKWTDSSLVLRISIGLVTGAVLGLLAPSWTWIGILGRIFVNALKAIAPVLVALLVTASIARAHGGLGARFRTVIALYLVSTLSAALVAVAGSTLFPVTLKLQAVAVGFIIGVIQDSVETALNSSGDVFFAATAEYRRRGRT